VKTPNTSIKGVVEPGEQVSVAFSATHPLPRSPMTIASWVVFVAIRLVALPRDIGWVSAGMVGLVAALGVVVVVSEQVCRVYAVGLVAGDVVVVRVGRLPWQWKRDRLVGRWSHEVASPELRGAKYCRIRIAGSSYWLEGDNVIRARLAVNNMNVQHADDTTSSVTSNGS